MKKKYAMKIAYLPIYGFLIITASTSTAGEIEPLCEPPTGDKSPFAGVEYSSDHVASQCISAYPRVDDWQTQGNWEIAVQRRCQSIYGGRFAGKTQSSSYIEACNAAEKQYRKQTARWPEERRPVERVKRPVCASTFAKGPDGEQMYLCSVYYSSEARSAPLEPLPKNAVVVEN